MLELCSKKTKWTPANAVAHGRIATNKMEEWMNDVTSQASELLMSADHYEQVEVEPDEDEEEYSYKGQVIDDGHPMRQFTTRKVHEADFEQEHAEQQSMDDAEMETEVDDRETTENEDEDQFGSAMITTETVDDGGTSAMSLEVPNREVYMNMSREVEDNRVNQDLEEHEADQQKLMQL